MFSRAFHGVYDFYTAWFCVKNIRLLVLAWSLGVVLFKFSYRLIVGFLVRLCGYLVSLDNGISQ